MRDMTKGSPARHIIMFALPLLLGNLFQQFYSMVDAIVVGKYIGVTELAAVGATGSLNFLVLGFVYGLAVGFTVLISQRYGADDERGVRKAYAMTQLLALVASVILTVIALLVKRPLLVLMNTPPDIIELSDQYISVIFSGIIVTMFYNVFSCSMMALGNSRMPLCFLIISSLLNVGLDLLLVIVFRMGVAGAAIATMASQLVSVLLCALVIRRVCPILSITQEDFRLDGKVLRRLLSLGLPLGFQSSITAIGGIAIQSAVNDIGTNAVAAYTAASKVEQLALQPPLSFGLSMATYSAQNLGAGRFDRIRQGVRSSMMISMTVCVLLGAAVAVFGRDITKLFMSNTESPEVTRAVLDYAQTFLTVTAFFVWALGVLYIYRTSQPGLGNTSIPFASGVVELVARVVIAMTLSVSMGFFGVSISSPIAWICATIPLVIAFYVVLDRRKRAAAADAANRPAETVQEG